ncbi:MAG: L-aspartate oxidase [Betaproteobacteria bacterium]|nr:L-aspartate oxidase [Betaproteobacteria bacterium]
MASHTPAPSLDFDVLIVGSGLAGLSSALLLSERYRVAIITKRAVREGSSGWAQGGIAAVWDKKDSFAAHVDDTLVAGAGLCDLAATQFVVEQAPHSARRIVHVTDATGAAVQRTLIERVQQSPNITLFENHTLVDLITSDKLPGSKGAAPRCLGLYALDQDSDQVLTFRAPHTLLATGGAGKVYLYTTNPDTATGDGIAAAWRAGCRVQNMEFIQFHPTCLYHPHAKSFLISEAVRGEGGRLLLPDGTRFMPAHDARAELAPRDVVARAIDFEMKKGGLDCVYLDISHQPLAFIQEHFPNIYARCLELGIDISRAPIPVVPAAHYTCGGVLADLQGRTDLSGLYAIGEAACSGLHGANRLASNSLVECMVFARAASHAIENTTAAALPPLPGWDDSRVTDADESVVISHNWDELRRFMWDYVGIVRTNKRLERAAHRIALLQGEINEFYANFHVSRDLLELRNLVQVADLIVQSARARHESRGLHFSRDYPDMAPQALPTTLVPGNAPQHARG